MHQIYTQEKKLFFFFFFPPDSLALCAALATWQPETNSIFPPENFLMTAELLQRPSGRHKPGTFPPAQGVQGALLSFSSSLLAGSYLETSWKSIEYLQYSSKP